MEYFKTCEMVMKGHPDKVCDQIADLIMDEYYRHDPTAKTAIEVCVSYKRILIMGEVTSTYQFDIEKLVRDYICEIGYNRDELGFNGKTIPIDIDINEQSPDIAMGVEKATDDEYELGAGDQGMMYGYATNETENYMPLPYILARKLGFALEKAHHAIPYLRPDGKMQVTVRYQERRPVKVTSIILSTQHAEIEIERLRHDILEQVIKKTIPEALMDDDIEIKINPTGRFVTGGPVGDTGLTGRKIIVDTYGGIAHHGGGSFSGKDMTKVDRSAAYYARYVAKNVVAAGLCDECELALSYAIGTSKPTMIQLETFGTEKVPVSVILSIIKEVFDFRPKHMIEELKLNQFAYLPLASYGHFGRTDHDVPFERLDRITQIKESLKKQQISL